MQKVWYISRDYIKRFVCKASMNQLATRQNMKCIWSWSSDKCPRCLGPYETLLTKFLLVSSTRTHDLELLTRLYPVSLKTTMLLVDRFIWSTMEGPTLPCDLADPVIQDQLRLPLLDFMRGCIASKVDSWPIQYYT